MREKRQYYPIGLQSFESLREAGYVYIDKTSYILELASKPRYIFISRPRRFGKSLLLSTMEEYFKGNRNLFKGLAIDTDDVDWTPRPVIKLSFSKVDPKSDNDLYQAISAELEIYEGIYGKNPEITTLPQRMQNLILRAYDQSKRKIVILVDEYDAPLLSTLENEELNASYRSTLKSMFTVIKDLSQYVYFEFVTGVSRFSHTSLFSGANNLDDITMQEEYSAICGITEKELIDNLMPGIRNYAMEEEISEEEALSQFKQNYDGYHFTRKCPDIYNPYSLMKALQYREIGEHWFGTDTPSYLLKAMKRDNFFLPLLDCIQTVESGLSVTESFVQNPVALMFEAGYLTIKKYEKESKVYTLGLPNEEVSVSFSKALLPIYSGYPEGDYNNLYARMKIAVIDGRADDFMKLLQTFLAGNPYGNTELGKRETYFKNNIFLIFKALGFRPHAEEQTCSARIDNMLETRRFVYIFELKVNGTAKEAMDQINEKSYFNPWMHSGKTIVKIGANYSSETNNIDEWDIELIPTQTL